MGCGAAQQVHFICAGGGNQQIRIHNTGLTQDIHGSAVALYGNHIVAFHTVFQAFELGIDYGNIVAFGGELTGQGSANFAVTCNDYVHLCLPKENDLADRPVCSTVLPINGANSQSL